jgi:hypothetical protein
MTERIMLGKSALAFRKFLSSLWRTADSDRRLVNRTMFCILIIKNVRLGIKLYRR